jgi:hypothetical protein
MIKITLIVFIISYSSWQNGVNVEGQSSPPPGGSPPPPMNSSLPPSSNPSSSNPPPGSCPNRFCPEPGSVCRVSPCPRGMSHCCVCPPGRLGDKCDKARQAIAQQSMRLNEDHHPSLNDATSANFTAKETTFCTAAKQIWENGFKARNQSVVVGCKCASMKSGSIIATLNIDMANNDSSSGTITPLSSSELSAAINQTCTGATCGNVDTGYVVVAASVDLCASNTTNNCSQYATCTFYSGLNYTCACKSGYRDDSSGSGFTCTRMCTTTVCGRGSCTEASGADVVCSNCPTGTSGQYCSGSYRVQQSLLMIFISFLILPLSIMNSSNQ